MQKSNTSPRAPKIGGEGGLSTLYPCGTAKAEQLNGEFKMSFKKASVAAALAISMTATPVLAQSAPSAASLSVASRTADTTEASEMRGGFIIPALAIIAVILGVLALASDGGDRPTSP